MAGIPYHLLKHSVSTTRCAVTVDSGGSPIETYTASLSNVPASVQPGLTKENEQYAAIRVNGWYTIYVPQGLDITEKDRLVWNGHTMDIKAAQNQLGGQSPLMQIIALENVGVK